MAAVEDTMKRRRLLKVAATALMCMNNPANLTDEEVRALSDFLEQEAKDLGFDGWIDAYHKL